MNPFKNSKAKFVILAPIFCFVVISGILFLKNVSCYQHPHIKEISSFKEAISFLENLPPDALVIFDLDETLVVSRSEHVRPAITEPFLSELIKKLQNRGIKTVALTNTMTLSTISHFTPQEKWRHHEMFSLDIDFNESFDDFFIFEDLPLYEDGYPLLFKGIIYSNRISKGKITG